MSWTVDQEIKKIDASNATGVGELRSGGMSWTVEWGVVARRDLRDLPRSVAERLDAAVIRFAETHRGPVTRLSPHDPRRLQLVVTGAIAYLHADEHSGVLHIGRVFRRAR